MEWDSNILLGKTTRVIWLCDLWNQVFRAVIKMSPLWCNWLGKIGVGYWSGISNALLKRSINTQAFTLSTLIFSCTTFKYLGLYDFEYTCPVKTWVFWFSLTCYRLLEAKLGYYRVDISCYCLIEWKIGVTI